MSLNVFFQYLYSNYFPDKLVAISKEILERFRECIKEMEKSYYTLWNTTKMVDCSWMLHRDESRRAHARESLKQSVRSKEPMTQNN